MTNVINFVTSGWQLTLCTEIVSFKIIRELIECRNNSVGSATKLRTERPKNRGSIPVRDKGFYIQSVHTRPVLGATPRPVNGNRGPYPEVKRPGCGDHSLYSVEVKKAWSYSSISNTPSWHGTYAQAELYFTICLCALFDIIFSLLFFIFFFNFRRINLRAERTLVFNSARKLIATASFHALSDRTYSHYTLRKTRNWHVVFKRPTKNIILFILCTAFVIIYTYKHTHVNCTKLHANHLWLKETGEFMFMDNTEFYTVYMHDVIHK